MNASVSFGVHVHIFQMESDRKRKPYILPKMGMSGKFWTNFIFLMYLSVSQASGFNSLMPFVGEESQPVNMDKPGCYMDGVHYPMGARWSPVFEPQGMMVCIKCQCLQVEKKGVALSRGEIKCRNIKDLCPKPECKYPVLKPGRCCKVCDSQDDFEEQFTFSQQPLISNNNIYSQDAASSSPPVTEFTALLVGRMVTDEPVRTRAVASVRMTLTSGQVRFSARYSRLDRPKYFQIKDLYGNVLFETPIQKGIRGDRKVCGVWRKVPPLYVSYFRHKKLVAVITTSKYKHGMVAGSIVPSDGAEQTETFSSLLSPSRSDGSGAVVTLNYDLRRRFASYVITLDGPLSGKRQGRFHISVLKGSHVVYQTHGTAVSKTSKLSGSWRVSKKRHRKQLARGRLRMRVTFADNHTLTGDIQSRLNCGVYQAVLTTGQAPNKERGHATGSAVIQIGDNGRLDYSIHMLGISSEVTKIRLMSGGGKGRNAGTLRGSEVNDPMDGWTNGTYKRLVAEDMQRLVNNQLYVSIATTRYEIGEIKGRLVHLEYHDHMDRQESPFTLEPVTEKAMGGGAHAWLSLEPGCVLHYDVVVAGVGKKSDTMGVVLASHVSTSRAVLRAPVSKSGEIIQNYVYTSDESADVPVDLFEDLDQGRAFLEITTKKRGQAIYRGNVSVANSCWQQGPSSLIGWAGDEQVEDSKSSETSDDRSCNFEGHIYTEGSTWLPDVNATCNTCSCVKGRILCEAMICPKLNCERPIHRPGDCCRSCPHEDSTELCTLGKDPRKYRVHSEWHPYLPLSGFSQCAICTCLPGAKTECYKLPCPTPACPKQQWVTSEEDPCCYTCSDVVPTTEPPEEEPQQDVNMNGACVFLGEVKANGDIWNPTIHPFGTMKCFFCECKDGDFKCGRQKCPKLDCEHTVTRPGACCEECDNARPNNNKKKMKQKKSLKKKKEEEEDKSCTFAGSEYRHEQKWKPKSSEHGECALCKCTDGSVNCKLRCPRVCREDETKHACCKHCPENRLAKWRKEKDKSLRADETSFSEKEKAEGSTKTKKKSKAKVRSSKGKNRKSKNKKVESIPALLPREEFFSLLN